MFPADAVTYVQGVPIGFIGVVLEDTPNVVLPSAMKGLKFLNESETINKYVRELQEKDVKTIVVLIHNGAIRKDCTTRSRIKLVPSSMYSTTPIMQ